jgi:hypothetical protein
MSLSARAFHVALCFSALTLVTSVGCNSAGGQGAGAGAAISGPLTMLPDYQSRAPRTCSSVTSAPSVAQAAVMVQCTMDATSAFGVGLVQDVKIEMGKARPFVYYSDAGLSGVDLTAQVIPLRGSYTSYLCNTISNMSTPGKSCMKSPVPMAVGACWKTSFGDYKCKLQGAPGGSLPKSEFAAAPTTF